VGPLTGTRRWRQVVLCTRRIGRAAPDGVGRIERARVRRGRMGQPVHKYYMAEQRASSPLHGQRAEPPRDDRVLSAGTWEDRAGYHAQAAGSGPRRQGHLAATVAATTAAPAGGGNQSGRGARRSRRSPVLPPASAAPLGTRGRVVSDTNIAPPPMDGLVLHTVRDSVRQVFVDESVEAHLVDDHVDSDPYYRG
jgi:hypothetical protein